MFYYHLFQILIECNIIKECKTKHKIANSMWNTYTDVIPHNSINEFLNLSIINMIILNSRENGRR